MARRRGTPGAGALAAALALLIVAQVVSVPTALARTSNTVLDPSPSGSNDWKCRPGDAHPNPVVLVHGLGGNQFDNWSYLSPIIAAHGYCVFSLTYGRDPLASRGLSPVGGVVAMEKSAREVGDFIEHVRDVTGSAKVDVVGHSEGTLVPAYYIKFLGGDRYVENYAEMTPLWQGTNEHGITTVIAPAKRYGVGLGLASPFCASCQEFEHGSRFLAKLNSDGGPAVDSVTYTEIISKYDEMVTPYTSGILHGKHVTNIIIQDRCPLNTAGHVGQATDPVVAQHVLNALNPDHPSPVICSVGGVPV